MSKATHTEMAAAQRRSQQRLSPARMPRILVAEDDAEMRRLLVWHIRNAGFDTIECADGYQLLDYMGKPVLAGEPDDFDLIVSDIRMPGVTGLEVLEGIHEAEWFVPMILITAFGNEEVHRQAEELGAAGMLDKPFEISDLIERIRQVLVLDSKRGDNWAPHPLREMEATTIPVDVVFSNMAAIPSIVTHAQDAAAVLDTLHDQILYCRLVITGPNGGLTGRYHVQIMVTLSDKVFVVRSNLKTIRDEAELRAAIPTAFQVALGKIQKHLRSWQT